MNAGMVLRVMPVALLLVALGASARTARAGTLVIANKDVGASELDKRELQKVFLGRTSELGGIRVVLATLRGGASHEEFMETYLQMTPQQFTNHWRKIVFSGTGKEPKSFDSEAELVSFVSKTPGAIGYIGGASAPSSVKTLDVN